MSFSVAGVPVTRDSAVITAGFGTALTRDLDQGVFGDLMWRF